MTYSEYKLREVRQIIGDCESVQESRNSVFKKEAEKIWAHERIKEELEYPKDES